MIGSFCGVVVAIVVVLYPIPEGSVLPLAAGMGIAALLLLLSDAITGAMGGSLCKKQNRT